MAVALRRHTTVAFHWQVVAVTAAPWLLILLAGTAGADVKAGPFAVLSIVNAMHVAVTLAVYADRDARPILGGDRRRFYAIPVALLVVGVAVGLFAPASWRYDAAALLAVWQVHHFTRQNLGMLSMWATSSGDARLSDIERRLFTVTGYAAMTATALRLRPDLPAGRLVELVGLACLTVSVWTLGQIVTAGCSPERAMMLTGSVVFWLPLFVYRGNTSTGLLAIGVAHAAQYYLMMFGLRGGRTREDGRFMVGAVVVAAMTAGLSHSFTGELVGWHHGLHLGLLASHFVVDAGFWKMRRPEVRTYMRRRFAFL